jgi:ABC-type uncharacterized transport system substrate-binding protein
MPAIYPVRIFADLGGLMSYGGGLVELYHQAGIYAGKILNGAKPADLPIQQSCGAVTLLEASLGSSHIRAYVRYPTR